MSFQSAFSHNFCVLNNADHATKSSSCFYPRQHTTASSLNTAQISPLTIVPINIEVAARSCSSAAMWSPFSTPSFSPHAAPRSTACSQTTTTTTSFQYSSPFFSPAAARAIYKSSNPSNCSIEQRGVSGNQRDLESSWPHANKARYLSRLKTASHFAGAGVENREGLEGKCMPKRSDRVDMSRFIAEAASLRALGHRLKSCTFCRTNGEAEVIFTSHSLKDADGKITCPILMQYSCPVCGASGEKTHTKKYCPMLQRQTRGELLTRLTSVQMKK